MRRGQGRHSREEMVLRGRYLLPISSVARVILWSAAARRSFGLGDGCFDLLATDRLLGRSAVSEVWQDSPRAKATSCRRTPKGRHRGDGLDRLQRNSHAG